MTDAPFPAEPRFLSDLIGGGWRGCVFEPFREGIEICRLAGGVPEDPAVALLKYAPGAAAPRHRHQGLETVLMLAGEQSDERGSYPAGALAINPEGSEHSVWSDQGCVALLHWAKPVLFLE